MKIQYLGMLAALLLAPMASRADAPSCPEGTEREVSPEHPCVGEWYCRAEGATRRVQCVPGDPSIPAKAWLLDENGGVVGEGHLLNGRYEGRWKFYWTPGVPKAQIDFHEGFTAGEVKRWHRNGALAAVEPTDEQGRPHGVWRQWWPNGQLAKQSEWSHGQDLLGGQSWYENGQIECVDPGGDEQYRLHGMDRCWYPSGARKLEISYRHGRRGGMSTYWYEDGTVRTRGLWVEGKKCGPWILEGRPLAFDCDAPAGDTGEPEAGAGASGTAP